MSLARPIGPGTSRVGAQCGSARRVEAGLYCLRAKLARPWRFWESKGVDKDQCAEEGIEKEGAY